MSLAPPPRRIQKLLIANRGEIASRILTACREHPHPITTYTLAVRSSSTSSSDDSHTLHSSHVLPLASASDFLSVPALVALAKKHNIDAIHPGYGFLSESAEFARRAWEEAGAVVIGPGTEVLAATGDKVRSKSLARECGVPVLEASEAVGDVDGVRRFAEDMGLPVMLKAVDGGGGRGIRLVKAWEELDAASKRVLNESPSGMVFVEKAAVEGFRHVEVQILGDGTGEVRHLWERECSIQRRYQKIVEMAPSTIADRAVVGRIIEAAVKMAKSIKYTSLGTFEFLANPSTQEFFFLEINPRLQVEHTVTEAMTGVDIVEAQLRIAQGEPLSSMIPSHLSSDPMTPPPCYSCQLRLCAENPSASFSLSIGRISNFNFPSGPGIRVDTALVSGHEATISPDFDSLIAKIIVTAASWGAVVRKARYAIQDTHMSGVQTNVDVLRAIVASDAFADGRCDTTWLEANMAALIAAGRDIAAQSVNEKFFTQRSDASGATGAASGMSSSTVLFRRGDAWAVKLSPTQGDGTEESGKSEVTLHHLRLDKVLRNDFPSLLSAEISFTTPSDPQPRPFTLTLEATTGSSSSTMAQGKHRRGDAANDGHVVIPFPGKLVEVLVDEGDVLREGDVVCVVQQMKMELEVRCRRGGKVKWIMETADGEEVAEGDLAVELATEEENRAKL